MKKLNDILEQLSSINGDNAKLEELKKHKDNEILRDYLRYSIDKRITFGVKQIDFHAIESSSRFYTNDIFAFFAMLEVLRNRRLTGKAAKERIDDVLSIFNPKYVKWLICCIQQDTAQLGIGRKLVNKVWPGLVLDFKVSLASPEEELSKFDWSKGAICETKLNGVRTIAIVRNGICECVYGRSGLPIDNFGFICDSINNMHLRNSFVLDGELHINNSLENTMSVFGFDMTKTDADFKTPKAREEYAKRKAIIQGYIDQASFSVFDCLTIEEWDNQKCKTPYKERRELIDRCFVNFKGNKLFVTPEYKEVNTLEEAREFAQEQIDKGLEGAIIKNPTHLYSFNRDRNWIKIKEFDTITVNIVDWIPSKTKYNSNGTSKEEMMGAFIVKCMHPNRPEVITFEVGTGKLFDEEFRIAVAKNPEQYIGLNLDVTVQRFTDTSAICPRAEMLRIDLKDGTIGGLNEA